MVQVRSTSQAIDIERRKIAWGRIDPGLKTLAKETYNNRKSNLFGPGFLEKASKKIDADKALAKVIHDGSSTRKRPFDQGFLPFFVPRRPSSVRQQGEAMPVQAVPLQLQEELSKQEAEINPASMEIDMLRPPPVPFGLVLPAGKVSSCLDSWKCIKVDPWTLQVV